ncbi:MAG: hypothetical protein KAG95_06520 [Bacteroidales bacterium]|nr:hypothetical protein [Bacteroidales bacterium]
MKNIKSLILIFLTLIFVFNFWTTKAQELSSKNKIIFKKAEKLTHKKKYLTAVHYYEEILKSNEHIETLMKIADIYFVSLQQKNYKKALEFYKRAEKAMNSAINENSRLAKRKKIKEFKQSCSNNIKICLSHIEKFDDARNRHTDAKKRLDDDEKN